MRENSFDKASLNVAEGKIAGEDTTMPFLIRG